MTTAEMNGVEYVEVDSKSESKNSSHHEVESRKSSIHDYEDNQQEGILISTDNYLDQHQT